MRDGEEERRIREKRRERNRNYLSPGLYLLAREVFQVSYA